MLIVTRRKNCTWLKSFQHRCRGVANETELVSGGGDKRAFFFLFLSTCINRSALPEPQADLEEMNK